MKCQSVVELIPLYYYGELAPAEEDAVEQHLDACAACALQADRQRGFAMALDRRVLVPAATLLADCRADLFRAIELNEVAALPPDPAPPAPVFWKRWTGWFPVLHFRVPLGAAALVALGFAAARLTAPGGGAAMGTLGGISSADTANVVSSVRSVQPAPDGTVQIVLDETYRRLVSGRLNDGNIQRLMLAAAHDENDPSLRVESVDILKSHSDSSEIRNLLLNRVLQDPNAGVRLKALDGLKPFIGDPQVQKVLAQVLIHDENPGVRIQAVDALTSHANDQMVGVLQDVVRSEDNTYVRRRCERALKDLNASIGTF